MESTRQLGTCGAEALGQNVMVFCRLLRAHGVAVTAGRIIDAFRALSLIDCFQRDDVYVVLESNLIARLEDRALFDALFHQFWSVPDTGSYAPEQEDASQRPDASPLQLEPAHGDAEGSEPRRQLAMYSPAEVLSRKDFGKMSESELAQARRLMASMARQMATALSRRQKARRKARAIDASRTMRRSFRYGGELLDLARRGPKASKTKMVALCDVSGSMDVYTKFLLQFLYGVQNGLRGVETLVFSTRLTRITAMLRRRYIDAALDLVSGAAPDWSGGTQIGPCIREFNDVMAPSMINSKTVVVLISDGWDTGDASVLDAEMARLQARSSRIVWLNPLLGDPRYEPLSRGMRTALPYIHDFMPAHNIESLRQFGRLVAGVV